MIRGIVLALLLLLSGQYNPAGPVFGHSISRNPCLVGGWPANEGSGATFHDVSSNANDIVASHPGNYVWGANAGFPGSSLTVVPGGGADSTISGPTDFTGTTPFSVYAWIKLTATGQQVFLSTILTPVFNGWELGTGTSGTNQLDFLLINNISGNQIQVHGSTNIQDGARHFVLATYDGSQNASGVKLYVDGVADTVTATANALTGSIASGRTMAFGYRKSDSVPVNNGVLNSAAVYNCIITPTQATSYNASGPGVN